MAGLNDELWRLYQSTITPPADAPDTVAPPAAVAPVGARSVDERLTEAQAPKLDVAEGAPKVKFSDAFAKARAEGKSEFEWEGGRYTTQTREEAAKARAAAQPGAAPQTARQSLGGFGGSGSFAEGASDLSPRDPQSALSGPSFASEAGLAQPLPAPELPSARYPRADQAIEGLKNLPPQASPMLTNRYGMSPLNPYKDFPDTAVRQAAEQPLLILPEKATGKQVSDWLGTRTAQVRVAQPGITPKAARDQAIADLKTQYPRSVWEGAEDVFLSFVKTTLVDLPTGVADFSLAGPEGVKATGLGVAKLLDYLDIFTDSEKGPSEAYTALFGQVDPKKITDWNEMVKKTTLGGLVSEFSEKGHQVSRNMTDALETGTKADKALQQNADGFVENFLAALNPAFVGEAAGYFAPTVMVTKGTLKAGMRQAQKLADESDIAKIALDAKNARAYFGKDSAQAAAAKARLDDATRALSAAQDKVLKNAQRNAVTAAVWTEAGVAGAGQVGQVYQNVLDSLKQPGHKGPRYEQFLADTASPEYRRMLQTGAQTPEDHWAFEMEENQLHDAYARMIAAEASGMTLVGTRLGSFLARNIGEKALVDLMTPAARVAGLGVAQRVGHAAQATAQNGLRETIDELWQAPGGEFAPAALIAQAINGKEPSLMDMLGQAAAGGFAMGAGVTGAKYGVAGGMVAYRATADAARNLHDAAGVLRASNEVRSMMVAIAKNPQVGKQLYALAQQYTQAREDGNAEVVSALEKQIRDLVAPIINPPAPHQQRQAPDLSAAAAGPGTTPHGITPGESNPDASLEAALRDVMTGGPNPAASPISQAIGAAASAPVAPDPRAAIGQALAEDPAQGQPVATMPPIYAEEQRPQGSMPTAAPLQPQAAQGAQLSRPVGEPQSDVDAQIMAMLSPASGKDAVLVPTQGAQPSQDVITTLQGSRVAMVPLGEAGVLYTTNRTKAVEAMLAAQGGRVNDDLIGRLLFNIPGGKPVDATHVTTAQDAAGNDLANIVTGPSNQAAAQAAAQDIAGTTGSVLSEPAADALARRTGEQTDPGLATATANGPANPELNSDFAGSEASGEGSVLIFPRRSGDVTHITNITNNTETRPENKTPPPTITDQQTAPSTLDIIDRALRGDPDARASVPRLEQAVAEGAQAKDTPTLVSASQLPAAVDIAPRRDNRSVLSREQANVIQTVMEVAFGRQVVLFTSNDSNANEGFVHPKVPGTLFINAGPTTVPQAHIVGHEFFHTLEGDAPANPVAAAVSRALGWRILAYSARTGYSLGKTPVEGGVPEALSEASADTAGNLFSALFTQPTTWQQIFTGVAQEQGAAKAKRAIGNFTKVVGNRYRAMRNVLTHARNDPGKPWAFDRFDVEDLMTASGLDDARRAIIEAVRAHYGGGVAGDAAASRAARDMGVAPGTVRASAMRGLQSDDGLPENTPRNRTLDGAELAALRRAAAGIESPVRGITLQVTPDGRAVVTGPARLPIPARFKRFAEQNGLVYEARRGPVAGTRATAEMPEDYREAGALYAQEMGPRGADRTDRTRFTRTRHASALPSRWPTSVGNTATVADDLVADLDALKLDPVQYAQAVDAVAAERGMAGGADLSRMTTDQKAEHIISRMVNNLLVIFDSVSTEIRERSKLWYEGANNIAKAWSERYNLTLAQASGILATLSPQKDWFMNVTMAERVIDILATQMDHVIDSKMMAAAFSFMSAKVENSEDPVRVARNKAEIRADFDAIRGKTLRQVIAGGNLTQMGLWVRAYDEAHHSANHAVVTPEGGFAGDKVNKTGDDASRAWGDFTAIGKAASIFVDGRPENINRMIGFEHKVRNFYNNILNPQDPRYTTIDTHAVAAALFRPLAGGDKAVLDNFGKTGGSSITGVSGAYPIYYEAYRRAAEARGVLPREMQSITWEAIRGLFTEGYKGDQANKDFVDFVWQVADEGHITDKAARQVIFDHAKGIENPDWWTGKKTPFRAKSYVGERPPFLGQKITFEIAPDPRDKPLKERWDALPAEAKRRISYDAAWEIVAKALSLFNDPNMKGELHEQTGGWLDDTNPSLSLWMHKNASGSKVGQLTRVLGHVLSQMAMTRTSPHPFKNANGEKVARSGVVYIDTPPGIDQELIYRQIRSIVDKRGKPYVFGHTSTPERMAIIHTDEKRISTTDLAKKIAAAIDPALEVGENHIYADFPEKGRNSYGLRGKNGPPSESSLRARSDILRAEADRVLDRLIGEFADQGVRPSLARTGRAAVIHAVRSDRERNEAASRPYARGSREDGQRLRVLGHNVVQAFTPAPEFKDRLAEIGAASPTFYELGADAAETFSEAITDAKNGTPYGAAVYVYPTEDYAGMRLFLTDDAKAGFALKGDDIVSVFSGTTHKGSVNAILQLAVDQGGRRLDAFDTVLPDLYAPHGFKIAARMSWNDEYQPDGWKKDVFAKFNGGEPDVVFMAYDKNYYGAPTNEDGLRTDDYDEAVRLQRQAINSGDKGPQASRARFFSPLARAVEAARQDTQPAQQWKLWLASNKGKLGLKDDEIQWSGINDYLDLRGKGKVTKAEIADYLSGNGVRVEDVVKGRTGGELYVAEANDFGDEWAVFDEEGAILGGTFSSEGEAQDAMAEMNDESPTNFSSYWEDSYKGGIPGTYREILVTLPAQDKLAAARSEWIKFRASLDEKYGGSSSPKTAEEKAESQRISDKIDRLEKEIPNFRSHHWDEPNVLVHVRLDEVTGADGKRYVRVGEIQSDFADAGEEQGFVGGRPADEVRLENKRDEFTAEKDEAKRAALQKTILKIEKRLREGRYDTPNAPVVSDTRAYVALGIKRAILHAIDVGADGVVFGTGDQNANLYDLSKQVDKIEVWPHAGQPGVFTVTAWRNGSVVSSEKGVSEEKLPDVIGKEPAKVAMADLRKRNGRLGVVAGDGLKVGGGGMRAFYDKIVPSVANEVLKKLGGGKVGVVEIADGSPGEAPAGPTRYRVMADGREWNATTTLDAAEAEANEARARGKKAVEIIDTASNTFKQPGFTIPDAMRAKVEGEGVPLFSKRRLPDTITVDGVERPTTNSNGQPIHPTEEGIRNFWRWAEGMPLVTADLDEYQGGGAVFEGYHGTTHGRIAEFKRVGAAEGFLGKGPYFTTTAKDASDNYAGVGPDLTNRIERAAEEIGNSFEDDEYAAENILQDYFDATGKDIEITEDNLDDLKDTYGGEAIDHAAKAQLKGDNDGVMMKTFIRLSNPADTTGMSTPLSYEIIENEDGDILDEKGTLVDWITAARTVAGQYGVDIEQHVDDLLSEGGDVGMDTVFKSALNRFSESYDDNGDLVSAGAIFAEIAEEAGYDGVIMDADRHFGSGKRGFGGVKLPGMGGVVPGTLHIVPFSPTQIKSAIGNTGEFDGSNPDIRKSTSRLPATITVDGVERPTTNSNGRPIHPTEEGIRNFWRWFGDSKVVDDQGRPLVMYHGTSKDTDFKKFKYSERGSWFTRWPESASDYAEDNDSQATKYNADTRQWVKVNTAGRVMPVYLRATNIRPLNDSEMKRVNAPGYARAQAQLFRELKHGGLDGVQWSPTDVVVFSPNQIKSAIGNTGEFDGSNPDIRYARPRKTEAELRADHADMFGQDQPAIDHIRASLDAAAEDYEAAANPRGHALTEMAAEALARRMGWSVADVTQALAMGGIERPDGTMVPAAVLLAAAAATARHAIAEILANPTRQDFAQRLADAVNLMIATRSNLSEVGRALSYAGWLQQGARMTPEERLARAQRSLKDATDISRKVLALTGNMSEDERAAIDAYNKALGDLVDTNKAYEEATEALGDTDQRLAEVRARLAEARKRRDEAQQKLRDLENARKRAEAAAGKAEGETPTPFDLTQAEGAARRAENESEAAQERMQRAQDRVSRAQDRLDKVKANALPEADIQKAERDARLAEAELALAKNAQAAARQKLADAKQRLADAKQKTAKTKADTPSPKDINDARGLARAAEQERDRAVAELRAAQKELLRLRRLRQARINRAIDAGQKLQGVQTRIAQMRKPVFTGKGGVSMEEIAAALGGPTGMARIQAALAKAKDMDPSMVALFLQGVANSLYKAKAERKKRSGVYGKFMNLLAGHMELFRAMILTGVFTHGVNILGNLLFQPVELILTRAIKSGLQGGVKGVGQHYKALAMALGQSVPHMMSALAFGLTSEFPALHFEALARAKPKARQMLLDLGGNKWMEDRSDAIPGIWGRVIRSVGFAPLGAVDMVFKTVPYNFSINMQRAMGKPVDYTEAVEMAEWMTFQNKLGPAMASLSQGINQTPGAGYIVPFFKTLANMIARSIDYTPVLGQIKAVLLHDPANKSDTALAVAHAIVGAGLSYLTLMLHGSGDDDPESRLSGTAPLDANDRKVWSARHEPLGLRLGDWLVPLWRLEPFATAMGLTIAAHDAYNIWTDQADAERAGKLVGGALGQALVGKSFMTGAEQFLSATANFPTEGYTYFTERLPQSIVLGSVIPNFIPQLGDMTDEYQREAKGWAESVQKRIPGWRESLPVGVDYLGRPRPNPRYGTILPLQRTPVREDPLGDWMRVNDVSIDADPKWVRDFPELKAELFKLRAAHYELERQGRGFSTMPSAPPGATQEEKLEYRRAVREVQADAKAAAKTAAGNWSEDVEDYKAVAAENKLRKSVGLDPLP